MASTLSAGGDLAELVAEMEPHWRSDWAWSHYEELVLRLSRRFGLSALCEIGGGGATPASCPPIRRCAACP
jgi:hypothetical protein